jgi:ABC-2 type transport system permease protein
MLQTPVDVLGGTIRGAAALSAVAVQLGWAVATLGGGRLLLRRATRKLVVQGG